MTEPEQPLTRRAARAAREALEAAAKDGAAIPGATPDATAEPPASSAEPPATEIFRAPPGFDAAGEPVAASTHDASEARDVPPGPPTEVFSPVPTELLGTGMAADATRVVPEQFGPEVLGARMSGGPAQAGPTVERTGFASLLARHPRAWLFSTLGVVFLLLGTGAVFTGTVVGSDSPAVATTVLPGVSPTPTPDPRPTPATVPAATHLRTCSVASLAADPRLLTFEGSVINASTGEVLFDRSATKPAPTASVLKVLTSAAALATLGPDYRLTTKVYTGTEPGSVVLVGGGDPTLTAVTNSLYTGAPKISDLAAQTLKAWEANPDNPPITKVITDSSMWDPNDNWDPSWNRIGMTDGDAGEITALMVDGSRANASRQMSPRSRDPIGDAGRALAAALQLPASSVSNTGTADKTKPLAEVQSQPLKVLIGQMLPSSDNTLAEMLARVVSVQAGGGGSSASLATVIPQALSKYGIDTTGIVIKDGSGLSANDAVPPVYVASLMAKVLAGGQNLNVIYDVLPVAGKSGTLSTRFTGASAIARGHVNAKTGWIGTSRTLAGVVHAKDGTNLAFAFYALGKVQPSAMTALDALTAGVFTCGNNLSNN